ncbi:MAG TPA: YggS family pyridoxal phosphate-dependent enzyme, partial [Candidatus Omnitrophota bacterium]|nr:YggS family pyridoxal phosphate-dependent enzyme [Candidatus Omnitrophota bacterium]
MTIASRIQHLKCSIREIAGRDVGLVLVTKTVSPERIFEAYAVGERDFGENRVQEWQEKKDALPGDVRWHLIGHLQTNKVKYVVGQVALIHSLDRAELADAIEKCAKNKGITEIPCLVQVNMSGEESKFGFNPSAVEDFVRGLPSRPAIRVRGLMVIGPLTDDTAKIRECFRKTKALLEDLKKKFPGYDWDVLSMGMSVDYKIAIEEGANLLRIGS